MTEQSDSFRLVAPEKISTFSLPQSKSGNGWRDLLGLMGVDAITKHTHTDSLRDADMLKSWSHFP